VYKGVYVNVEQRDKQMLVNHGLWHGSADTWFYEYDDPYTPTFEEAPEDGNGNPIHSPAYQALSYLPFRQCCAPPLSNAAFAAQLSQHINMEGLLTYAAVSAFHTSPDDLFTKGKNFFHVDYSANHPTLKREYIQWDLDSAFTRSATLNIYNQTNSNDEYEDWIIDNPVIRPQYSAIMQTLVDGPFGTAGMGADLSAFEIMLADALAADPYALEGDTVEDHFDGFENYLAARHASVLNQLP
jgi:hypothetical protein